MAPVAGIKAFYYFFREAYQKVSDILLGTKLRAFGQMLFCSHL